MHLWISPQVVTLPSFCLNYHSLLSTYCEIAASTHKLVTSWYMKNSLYPIFSLYIICISLHTLNLSVNATALQASVVHSCHKAALKPKWLASTHDHNACQPKFPSNMLKMYSLQAVLKKEEKKKTQPQTVHLLRSLIIDQYLHHISHMPLELLSHLNPSLRMNLWKEKRLLQ